MSEPVLKLLTRPECHLCEETAALLDRLRVPYSRVNIETDPALETRFGEQIPVLLRDDEVIARAPVSLDSLRTALGGAATTRRQPG